MKLFFIFAVLLAAIGCGTHSAENFESFPTPKEQADSDQPVLVELFTSEGCSSCPPADRALIFLETQQPVKGAEIITLAFHVDYWDRLGWKDRFSSPQFSQRQENYTRAMKLDSNYTPQMVVDGEYQFVGSNTGEASKSITKASEKLKGNVKGELVGNSLKVQIDNIPKHSGSTVFLAIAEDGLNTNVRAGENRGEKLEHVSVVRDLKSIGKIESNATDHNAFTELQFNPEWRKENVKFVVFVQENDTRKILAVGKAK